MTNALRIAMLGFGAIGRSLAAVIRERLDEVTIVGIAKRTAADARDRALVSASTAFVRTPAELVGLDMDMVVECAGHEALAAFGPVVLQRGRDLLLASVGALADDTLANTLRDAAERGGAKILISTGAIGALDLLTAARMGGLEAVTYTGRKPPRAWAGTSAAGLAESAIVSGVTLFEGTAREAALRFPQNANVAAAVALAGLGFEQTRVQLVADPALHANEHRLSGRGAFGSFELTISGNAQAGQPKTSMLVAFSLARCLATRQSAVAFA